MCPTLPAQVQTKRYFLLLTRFKLMDFSITSRIDQSRGAGILSERSSLSRDPAKTNMIGAEKSVLPGSDERRISQDMFSILSDSLNVNRMWGHPAHPFL
jgi:hypothetical protein